MQEQFALGYRLARPQTAGNVPYNSAKNLLMPASDLKTNVPGMARLIKTRNVLVTATQESHAMMARA